MDVYRVHSSSHLTLSAQAVSAILSNTALVLLVCYSIYGVIKLLFLLDGKIDNIYWLTPISLIGILRFVIKMRFGALKFHDALLVFIVILLGLVSWLQVTFFGELFDATGRSSYGYLFMNTKLIIVWVLAGYAIAGASMLVPQYFLWAFSIAGILFVLSNVDRAALLINYSELRASTGEVISHLTISNEVYILAVISFASVSGWLAISSACLAIAVLLVTGGRADFICFLVALIFIIWQIRNRISSRSWWAYAFLCLLILMLFLLNVGNYDALVSRMFFSDGLTMDASYSARVRLFLEGLQSFPSAALVGNVADLITRNGSIGSYIHNVLSAWQLYGAVVFLVCIVLLLQILQYSFKIQINTSLLVFRMFRLFAISTIVGMLFAKYIGWGIGWLTIGMYLSIRSDARGWRKAM